MWAIFMHMVGVSKVGAFILGLLCARYLVYLVKILLLKGII